MKSRIDLKHIGTLPQALAHCAIVRALRPYLKSDAPFVACFVVEGAVQVGVYEHVAEALLLRRDPDRIRRVTDRACVATFEGGKVIESTIRGSLQSFLRVVFIFDAITPVPIELRASCDVFNIFGPPDNSLVQSAISAFYRGGVTAADSELIAESDWNDLATLFRPGRSTRQSLSRLLALKLERVRGGMSTDVARADAARNLEALNGYGEATRFGLDLAQDLADYRAGKIVWSDVERGVLLVGPPGTGKTSFARRLAKACGVPLVSGSYSEWQATGTSQGDLLKAMRKSFRQATSLTPCVMLIDELGAFTTRGTQSGHAEYMIGPVNAMLELLDGIEGREGVVVVATANSTEDIDKALLRAGRIDTHIEVELPDAEARCYILEEYLNWQLPTEARSEVATKTQGLTGADLELVAKRVRRHVRRSQERMSMEAVMACLPRLIALPTEKVRTAAVHEAGHALVALILGRKIRTIQVMDCILDGQQTASIGRVEVERDTSIRHTGPTMLEEIMITFGGMAAETEVFGAHDYGAGGTEQSDLVMATDLATQYEAIYGMGDTMISEPLGNRGQLSRARMQNAYIWSRIDDLLRAQLQRTREVLAEHGGLLRALAERLGESKVMSGLEVMELAQSHGWSLRQNHSQLRSA